MAMAPNAAKKAQAAVTDLKAKWKAALDQNLIVQGIGTNEAYSQLEAAVKASAQRNENQAATVARIKGLAEGAVSLAKVIGLI